MSNIALEGIKVVEYANEISGPYCGKLLADLGADVIKVEPPEGDSSRLAGPFPENQAHPEKSGLFLYLNTSKRGMVLDLKHRTDREKFIALLKWADLLIDNYPVGHMEDLELGFKELKKINPKLVYTSITPYGRTGRRAKVNAGEMTLQHAGGLANLLPARSVDIDRPPVKLGGYAAGYNGGIYSALVSLAAVIEGQHTGKGRMIDVSLHEVVLSLVFPMAVSTRYMKTTWSRVPDRPPATGRMETADGYIVLGAADDHHFRKFRELLGKPKWLESDQWDNMYYRVHHMMDIAPMMAAWMKKQKKHDIFHRAAKKGIPIGPILSAKEVLEDPQYVARGYFVEVDHPAAGKYKYAGWPYKMSVSPPRVSRPAPLLGQHNTMVFDQKTSDAEKNSIVFNDEKAKTKRLPSLKGLRVLDFSWLVAGPYATRFLAEFGADVIKVEGHKRIELLRRSFPWPLPEPAPTELGVNQSILFNCTNINKKSVTIDLTKPEGHAIAEKLVEMSDVVMDNMRPGAMDKLGLGYKDLIKIRPDIIVLNSSSRGLNGPLSEYLGFAVIHHSHGGGAYITGYPDDHPSHATPADVDFMNALTCAFAILAAVHYRMQTGEGQFIDFSQTEGVSSLIGEVFLEYLMTSKIPERMGNAHPKYAPHNVYRCWGVDRWLALEIHSDEEFKILAEIISKPELIKDARFSDMASRKKNEAELDRIIGAWIRQRDRDWMVEEFCKHGLAAAPSRDARDFYADRHLRDRGSIISVDHPELGPLQLQASPWKIDGRTPEVTRAPLLGEHNQYVLGELLGLRDDEIAELRQKEIIM